ncbi:hypothetical protein [Chondromyces apiculatus]|uniref:Uncharacterized protein n=1 Tax=Chondromyces apiculatus DSM 436 TaxID=1192034 RepID=A0A017TE58_9BACT|nr:hypothetical protein [Chondromyces apiculatus]EYF07207.1 Hypothetical protein CAP_0686 [Chondromyces apiculatus DSM 436]
MEADDTRFVRCAIYTRQSVEHAGDDPALASCAMQRAKCIEFIREKTRHYWYPIGEHLGA